MTTDTLARYEKAPVAALFAAAGVQITRWYMSGHEPAIWGGALPWVMLAGGIAAAGAIDGAMIATVASARDGRRSKWTWITIAVAALFNALVALSLYDILPTWAGGALHAAFAATSASYLMHLQSPRHTSRQIAPTVDATKRQRVTPRVSVTPVVTEVTPPQLTDVATGDTVTLEKPVSKRTQYRRAAKERQRQQQEVTD